MNSYHDVFVDCNVCTWIGHGGKELEYKTCLGADQPAVNEPRKWNKSGYKESSEYFRLCVFNCPYFIYDAGRGFTAGEPNRFE